MDDTLDLGYESLFVYDSEESENECNRQNGKTFQLRFGREAEVDTLGRNERIKRNLQTEVQEGWEDEIVGEVDGIRVREDGIEEEERSLGMNHHMNEADILIDRLLETTAELREQLGYEEEMEQTKSFKKIMRRIGVVEQAAQELGELVQEKRPKITNENEMTEVYRSAKDARWKLKQEKNNVSHESWPKILVLGVRPVTKEKKLKLAIWRSFLQPAPKKFMDYMQVCKVFLKGGERMWVFTCPPWIFKKLMGRRTKRFVIEGKRVKYREFVEVVECFKCLRLDHWVDQCEEVEPGRKCKKCGSWGHKTRECRSTEYICVNCKDVLLPWRGHGSCMMSCPLRMIKYQEGQWKE